MRDWRAGFDDMGVPPKRADWPPPARQYWDVSDLPGGPKNSDAGLRGMARAAAGTLSPSRVPKMARHNYRRELIGACAFPFALVLFEGSVLSVLVRIGFEGAAPTAMLNVVAAFIGVLPALANLSSFFWVRLVHGRDKIRTVVRIQLTMLAAALLLRRRRALS